MREQIFISYRRDGGDVTAKLICEALKNRGFSVFYDYDSLSGGYFDDRIFAAIDGCNDFILVLPEHSLDRCVNEDDWVRQEIAHALSLDKNIIPVMLPGFQFPAVLPRDIENVSRVNGVQFVMNYFESVIEAIEKRLTAKPAAATTPGPHRQAGTGAVSLIRNVCTFGSCDFNSTSPADAYYSEKINRNKYNIVYFQVTTAPIPDKSLIVIKTTIYDTANNVVYDDTSSFAWAPDYNQIVLSWVIRGRDGSFVKADRYRAVFQIGDSMKYEYHFQVTAGETSIGPTGPTGPTEDPGLNDKERKNLELYLACPKVFVNALLTFLCLVFFAGTLTTGESAGPIIFGILFLVSYIAFFRRTRKFICNNPILAFLLTTVGGVYYGLFLSVFTVLNLFMGSTWKKKLGR